MKKSYVEPWKKIADHQTVADVVQHCFLIAFFARESNVVTRKEILRGQIAKSFTPVTNENKLENGMEEFFSIKKEVVNYAFAPIEFLENQKVLHLDALESREVIFGGSKELQRDFWEFVKENSLFCSQKS